MGVISLGKKYSLSTNSFSRNKAYYQVIGFHTKNCTIVASWFLNLVVAWINYNEKYTNKVLPRN